MSVKTTGPDILNPLPTDAPRYSAFLWAGLASMGLAVLVCFVAIVLGRPGGGPGWSPRFGLMIGGALLVTGILFLYAQSRYLFWRRTAGIVELRTGERDQREIPTERERLSRKWDLIIVANLIVIGALPRLLAMQHSLWYDELWSVLHFMVPGPVVALTKQESFNNHLLNSFLGSLCVQVYTLFHGFQAPTVPPAWLVRLPAFVFGVASPPMLYIAARRVMERPPAVAAAFLLALSPTAIDFSAQARGYSPLIFFAIAQTYWLISALRTSSASSWLWWIACCALGVAAHLYFAFVITADLLYLAILAVWTWRNLLDPDRCRALFEQAFAMISVWACLGFAVYASVLPTIRAYNARFAGEPPMARVQDIFVPLLQMWGGVPPDHLRIVFYVAALIFVIAGVSYLAKRPSGGAIYLPLLLAVSPALTAVAHPHYLYLRFFLFLLPAFLTLVACGMWSVSVWALGPKPERAGFHALTLGVFCMAYFGIALPGMWQVIRLPKQDYEGAAARINDELSRGRVFVGVNLGSEYFRPYMQERFRQSGIPPNQKLLDDYLAKKRKERKSNEVTKDQLADLVRMFKTVLVVDPDISVKPGAKPSAVAQAVRDVCKEPVMVFPGRFADWPYRWLDGNSDIKVYQLDAAHVPGGIAPPPKALPTPAGETAP